MLESQVSRLVPLLLAADRRDEALNLLADDEWLALRVGQYGFDPFVDDARQVLEAAAAADRDDDVVRVLMRVERASRAHRTTWPDGSAAAALAAAQSPKRVRGILRALGSSGAPWASLLAAVKLLDLRAVADAATLLKQVAEEDWPGYQPTSRGDGLPGWSDIGPEPIVSVLVRIVEASATHAARIVRRLYEQQRPSAVPNSYSVWASLLEQLVSAHAAPNEIAAAVEQVHLTILPKTTGVPALVDRLAEARQRAIEAVSAQADVKWLLVELGNTMGLYAWAGGETTPEDADADQASARTRHFARTASLLLHLVRVHSKVHDVELKAALADALERARQVAAIPAPPKEHDCGNRSFALASYAMGLEAILHPRAQEAALAALLSCDLDARSDDPPGHWVRRALQTLDGSKDASVREKVGELRRSLGSILSKVQPEGGDVPWVPRVEARDELEYGLALLREPRGTSPPPFRAPRRPGRKPEQLEPFRDQVLRSLIMGWSGVGDPQALVHIERLDGLRSDASGYSTGRAAVARNVARRMNGRAAAALLRTAARGAIAERDMNAAGDLIADLAPHDNEEALRLFEEWALTDASDRGGIITMVLMGLLGPREVDPASIAAWVDRLPPSEGPLHEYELYLLAFEHPLLEALAERTAERCVRQLEADVNGVFAVNEDQRPSIREIEERMAQVAVPLAAFAAAHSLGPAKDRILRAAARVVRETQRPAIQQTARKVMLQTFIQSWTPVRQPEFVDFYLGMLGEPSRSAMFPSSLDGMEDSLAMGWALFDAVPERARALADSAFSSARERLVDDSALDDMGRVANVLVEVFASATGGRPHEVTAALKFGEAAERWALKGGFAEVAAVLDELAGLARKDGVRTVLAGAATKMRLKAGDLPRAESWLQTAPFEALDALDIVSAIPTAPEHRSWSRRMLADRLGQLLTGAALDADWLGKLISVGIESMNAEQASARLGAIEDAWSQEEAARTA